MTVTPGVRIGPYEVLSPLGAGGMGEVYRARDTRLGRDVALKVLAGELAADATRLRRFEREARAVSALNAPSIVTLFDVGTVEGVAYIAMELIEGQTLRQLLQAGTPPLKKLLSIAAQVAEGLARAHEAGIVHRDIKPDNIMVTAGGAAKILDFGLAKRTTERGADDQETTASIATEPGSVVGTARYMSPEQAAGRHIDFRTDQFSFGSVLYEMATGRPAFAGDTKVDTLSAILHLEPEPVGRINPKIPPPLRWIIERCLAKDAGDRYASTQDLARDLRAVREHLSEIGAGPAASVSSPGRRDGRLLAAGAAALLALGAGTGLVVGGFRAAGPPDFHQLTFRVGEVGAARFAPDGQTVVYSAEWERRPPEVFLNRIGSSESRPLGLPDARLLAVSGSGEMLVSIRGTLARMGIASAGAPREILDEVTGADWSPDGRQIAVVRDVGGRSTLEYPIGHPIFQETAGYVGAFRVSPDGRLVAFIDHPVRDDMSGRVMVVSTSGQSRVLTGRFNLALGLAWPPDGREVWFSASPVGGNQALYAVTKAGRQRLVSRSMGSMVLWDVSSGGRALVTDHRFTDHVMALGQGAERERELTWLDLSLSRAISVDGRTVLLLESGEGGGEGNSVFLRGADGSPAVRLGEGDPWALSRDGRFVAAFVEREGKSSLVLYPTGSGQTLSFPLPGLEPQWAEFLPDGRQVLFQAGEAGRGTRLYVQDVAGGAPRPIGPYGYRGFESTLSPDGRTVVVESPDRKLLLFPLRGGQPVPIAGITAADIPRGWTGDGCCLYVTGREYTIPRRVEVLDIATGSRRLWKELGPRTGAVGIHVTPDGGSYVYTFAQVQGDLYLIDGLK